MYACYAVRDDDRGLCAVSDVKSCAVSTSGVHLGSA